MPNTIAAALLPDFLSKAVITICGNRLAGLRAFSRDFGVNPLSPLAIVQVRKATVGATGQSNATNFESGNTTLAAVPVTVSHESVSFHVLNSERESGHRLEHLAEINAQVLADRISDKITALLLSANFASPLAVGIAAQFDAGDLSPVLSAAKNFGQKNLLLDGGHLAYLAPANRNAFKLGEEGAYGFDLIAEQNRWTSATPNTVGFVCGQNAIAVASGGVGEMPANEFISIGEVRLPGSGLTVWHHVWFSRAGRVLWASYDVMFGAAVGDATAGKLLVTS